MGPNDEHGAPTTTIKRRNLGAGNTSSHEDPYIARLAAEQDRLRLERGFRGERNMFVTRECASFLHHTDNVAACPGDAHSATTTTTNRRGLEAGSTTEAPEIIVTAPRDGNEPVAATINGRHHRPGSILTRGPRDSSTFTPLPDDDRRGLVINPFTERYYAPRSSRLRRSVPEADDRNRIVPEDVLRAVNTTNGNGYDVEASTVLITYATKLL